MRRLIDVAMELGFDPTTEKTVYIKKNPHHVHTLSHMQKITNKK